MAHEVSFQRREVLKPYCSISPIQNSMKLDVYFRSGKSLVQQAESYHRDGYLDNAYIYYKRFLSLALNEIPKHKQFKTSQYAEQRSWLLQERSRLMNELEGVVSLMDTEEAAKAGIAAGQETKMGSMGSLANSMPEAPSEHPSVDSAMNSLEARLAALKGINSLDQAETMDAMAPSAVKPSAPPAPPDLDLDAPAPMPLKDVFRVLSQDGGKPSSAAYGTVGMPPSNTAHPISAHTQMLVEGKRPLNLPDSLVAIFSEIAHPNTITPPHGLETCGILAGKIVNEMLEVTHLIIPKQEASANQCGMTNEDELFNYCFEHDLLTLGWIHTHPTQSCFMSSVDLHTHAAYQALLPEAVAIVVAPTDSDKRVGVFRLTDPPGLQTIMTCTLKGFHQHPSDITIYQDVNVGWKTRDFDTFDMR